MESSRSILFYFKTIFPPSWTRISNDLHRWREMFKFPQSRQTHNGLISNAAYFLFNPTSSSELDIYIHDCSYFLKVMEAEPRQ